MTAPVRHGAPLLPTERHDGDGTAARAGAEALRAGPPAAAAVHLPEWRASLTPHVLRHFCASQLYLGGMDLIAIQQVLGHARITTTMGYVHVHASHVEDAWLAGQERAARRCCQLSWEPRWPLCLRSRWDCS
jgi:integrase